MHIKKTSLLLALLLSASYAVHAQEPKRVSVNVVLEEKNLIKEIGLGAIDGAIVGAALTFLLQLSIDKTLDYNTSMRQYKMNTLINSVVGALLGYYNAYQHNAKIEQELARKAQD